MDLIIIWSQGVSCPTVKVVFEKGRSMFVFPSKRYQLPLRLRYVYVQINMLRCCGTCSGCVVVFRGVWVLQVVVFAVFFCVS